MRVTLLQTDIVWEDKQENLRLLRRKLKALRGVAEIVVLPETFSTGFSMDSRRLAEPVSGEPSPPCANGRQNSNSPLQAVI